MCLFTTNTISGPTFRLIIIIIIIIIIISFSSTFYRPKIYREYNIYIKICGKSISSINLQELFFK